jgi:hypothetical protein
MIANILSFEQLADAKKNLKPLIFKGLMKESPSWADFINSMDYKFNNPLLDESTYHGGTFVKTNNGLETELYLNTKLSPSFWNAAASEDFTTNRSPFLVKYADDLISIFSSFINNNSWTLKALTNLVSHEDTNNIHKDRQDVLSWHCINTVEYRFFDADPSLPYETKLDLYDQEYTSIVLEEGDVIFMPAGLVHQAVIIEPRATLLLDFFLKNN